MTWELLGVGGVGITCAADDKPFPARQRRTNMLASSSPPRPKGQPQICKPLCYFIRSLFTSLQSTLRSASYKSSVYKVWKLHKNNFYPSSGEKYKLVLFTLLGTTTTTKGLGRTSSSVCTSHRNQDHCTGLLSSRHIAWWLGRWGSNLAGLLPPAKMLGQGNRLWAVQATGQTLDCSEPSIPEPANWPLTARLPMEVL